MEEAPTTTLTVAKLKALCVLNDLSASGKKAELLTRLLDAGVDKETLGIEVFDESTATFQVASEEPAEEDAPVMLSLEDDDTLTPDEADEPAAAETVDDSGEEDTVLEAEILEADLIEDVPEAQTESPPAQVVEKEHKTPRKITEPSSEAMTLREMIQRPQSVAVLLTLIILGAGGWYYMNNQIEPFTADSLRYGDSMGYMITGPKGYGEFIATEEYVSLVTDQLDDPPEYCKIKLNFQGNGEAAVVEGTSSELFTQTTDDRLGAMEIKGGQGMSWLAVESLNSMKLSTFDISGHYPLLGTCQESTFESISGQANVDLRTWRELREQIVLATELDFDATLSSNAYDGTVYTYGVGGLLGDLEELSPGLGMVVAPVELSDFFGNDYITKDATGTSSGWEWRVTGSEKVGSTNMWKVTASHRDVRDFCLGMATMNLWLDPESPWAARQTVDVSISSSDASQSSCSAWQQRGIDAVLPEGELELHHTFERVSLNRGVKAIELGKSYDNRPQANDLNPDDDDLVSWGVDGTHLPDNSTERAHPLDVAMTCLSEFNTAASGATTALDGNGYVWRAVDSANGSATEWNISWVDVDNTAGWLRFSVSGSLNSGLTCEFLAKGTFDDAITHNREAIPEVLPLEAVEARLMDNARYPALTGTEALFSSTGANEGTTIGYLVVVPGTGFGIDLGDFFDTSGATTVDVQRQWETDSITHQFSLLADATDGRLIGWTKLTAQEL